LRHQINSIEDKMKTNAITLIFLPLSIVLTGCGSSEPSEAEMFDAMKNSSMQLVNESDRADFRKSGCEKTGEKTFKCAFGFKDGKGTAMNMGFTKVDGKWQIMPNP
jgi:major membrane immunogen (membrane-anchored lipoprotein)